MKLPFEIILERNHWIAINKPCGMVVEENPFEESVEVYLQDYFEGEKGNFHLGVVHRLDRVTSGVLLFAKRKSALKSFNKQFQERQVQKVYLAEVEGHFPKGETILTNYLARDKEGKKAIEVSKKNRKSKQCVLEVTLRNQKTNTSVLEIKPNGGRYHQIRAQLALAGYPVLHDHKYGARGKAHPKAVNLHSWKLQLRSSIDNNPIFFEAPLPEWALHDS